MSETIADSISQNIIHVQQNIASACIGVGRDPAEVKLVAVSKQRSTDEIRAALVAGTIHLGENRVDEAAEKRAAFGTDYPDARWHMIGNIQSRKAKEVAAVFDVIHSVDSEKLLLRLDRFAGESGRRLDILIQVNISGEDSKSGLPVFDWENDNSQRDTLWHLTTLATQCSHINAAGLMTMAPYIEDDDRLRRYFASMRRLRDALRSDIDMPADAWPELSMGMSNDYALAVEEGATIVRVGRAIFGERSY